MQPSFTVLVPYGFSCENNTVIQSGTDASSQKAFIAVIIPSMFHDEPATRMVAVKAVLFCARYASRIFSNDSDIRCVANTLINILAGDEVTWP